LRKLARKPLMQRGSAAQGSTRQRRAALRGAGGKTMLEALLRRAAIVAHGHAPHHR
jgi:hypothetical protein